MSGLASSGAANLQTGGDSSVPPLVAQLHAADDLEPARSAAHGETAASELSDSPDAGSWRTEVAARLERYRTRRKPRTPRYPSLLLPFDSPASWGRGASSGGSPSAAALTTQVEQYFESHAEPFTVPETATPAEPPRATQPALAAEPYLYPEYSDEQSSKVIEFPRSAAIPILHASELADPIFDRPRIVEAPEVLPPPPALGGMLIEPLHRESTERRSDFPLVSPSATIAHRALAALADGVILSASLAAFGAIFLRFNPVRGPLPLFAGALGVVAVLLWAVYKFLFVIYTGASPGLRMARLQLVGFDGRPVDRRMRRWRVLASFLSAFSAGLGYFWCLLDEDELCWHDRITRTHVTPVAKSR